MNLGNNIGFRFGLIGIAWAIVAVSYYIAIRLRLLAANFINGLLNFT